MNNYKLVLQLFILIIISILISQQQTCNVGNTKIKNNGKILVCANSNNQALYAKVCAEKSGDRVWSGSSAEVACRSLDYPGVDNNGTPFGGVNNNPNVLKIHISCKGDEHNLSQCKHSFPSSCKLLKKFSCQRCVTGDETCPSNTCNNNTGKCVCPGNCENGEFCEVGICICPQGFNGTFCQIPIQSIPTTIQATIKAKPSASAKGTGIPHSSNNDQKTIKTSFSSKSASIPQHSTATHIANKNNTDKPQPKSAPFQVDKLIPVFVLIPLILLVIFMTILLTLILVRIRKSKRNKLLRNHNNAANSLQTFSGTWEIEDVTYETSPAADYLQVTNLNRNPYIDLESFEQNNSHNNSRDWNFQGNNENPLVSPYAERNEIQMAQNENPLYGHCGISDLEYDDEIYQTYVEASECPYAESSMVVANTVERAIGRENATNSTSEVIYSNSKSIEEHKNFSFFVQEKIYWEPPKQLDLLFNQMSAKKYREIARNALQLEDKIGSGQFGEVYRAIWNTSSNSETSGANAALPVAVKTLQNSSGEELRSAFIQEAAIMGQFSHSNVLRLLGIVSRVEPFMIVTELMHTELRKFLITLRTTATTQHEASTLLLKFSREIASGMSYLASKHFIHRDLAARNVLVARNLTCRIADFGMSRQLREEGDYYSSKGGIIPLKWTAPEAIFYQRYSEKSDVWSFGMTLYEIWGLGKKPWSHYSNEDLLETMSELRVMGPTTGCPNAIYSVMVECWQYKQELRPTFVQVTKMLTGQDSDLLKVAPSVNVPEDALRLGFDPHLSKDMYPEIQSRYSSQN